MALGNKPFVNLLGTNNDLIPVAVFVLRTFLVGEASVAAGG